MRRLLVEREKKKVQQENMPDASRPRQESGKISPRKPSRRDSGLLEPGVARERAAARDLRSMSRTPAAGTWTLGGQPGETVTERLTKLFDGHMTAWVASACEEWGFDTPVEPILESVRQRLPPGIRAIIGLGIERVIIIPAGHTFKLKGLTDGKGPYKWLSRYNQERRPNPNWEYYVQVAEFVRLTFSTETHDTRLTFEDDLMDIGIYRHDKLVVCCEVKETSAQATQLLSGIKRYQSGVDWTTPDRGNDALRKFKYLIKRRPKYFCVVAIGIRHEFSVAFPTQDTFMLQPDLIALD